MALQAKLAALYNFYAIPKWAPPLNTNCQIRKEGRSIFLVKMGALFLVNTVIEKEESGSFVIEQKTFAWPKAEKTSRTEVESQT